ncbi:hypothetical protein Tco_0588164 [Tanacetum coccineum]
MLLPNEIALTLSSWMCQPINFKGTKGVVGLTQWAEKMEYVFLISNCAITNQVKFASCTLQGSALTWWNSTFVPEESAKVERYVGGLSRHDYDSVRHPSLKVNAEAIEFVMTMMTKD